MASIPRPVKRFAREHKYTAAVGTVTAIAATVVLIDRHPFKAVAVAAVLFLMFLGRKLAVARPVPVLLIAVALVAWAAGKTLIAALCGVALVVAAAVFIMRRAGGGGGKGSSGAHLLD